MLKHYEFTIYDVYPKDPIVKHLDELGIIYSFGNYAKESFKDSPFGFTRSYKNLSHMLFYHVRGALNRFPM